MIGKTRTTSKLVMYFFLSLLGDRVVHDWARIQSSPAGSRVTVCYHVCNYCWTEAQCSYEVLELPTVRVVCVRFVFSRFSPYIISCFVFTSRSSSYCIGYIYTTCSVQTVVSSYISTGYAMSISVPRFGGIYTRSRHIVSCGIEWYGILCHALLRKIMTYLAGSPRRSRQASSVRYRVYNCRYTVVEQLMFSFSFLYILFCYFLV